MTPARTTRRCRMGPAAPARHRISAASCSIIPSAPTSPTCPIAAQRPAMQDLMGGRVDFTCAGITTAKPLIDADFLQRGWLFSAMCARRPCPTCRPRWSRAPRSKPIPGTRSSFPGAHPTSVVREAQRGCARGHDDCRPCATSSPASAPRACVSDQATPEYLGRVRAGARPRSGRARSRRAGFRSTSACPGRACPWT